MYEWIIDNREWVFSGFGVTISLCILGAVFRKKASAMSQKSGKNSVNIQAGGDISYKVKK